MAAVRNLLARIASIGCRLSVLGDSLKYEGPPGRLTSDLREEIRRHKAELLEQLRLSVPELLAHFANHGVWIALDETGYPRLLRHDDADLDGVDEAVIEELHARADETVTWLKKPVTEMTDAELGALGFESTVRDAEWSSDDEWYSPPTERPTRECTERCRAPGCEAWTSAEVIRKYGGYCWSCSQMQTTQREDGEA